jgi:hypothetical protein
VRSGNGEHAQRRSAVVIRRRRACRILKRPVRYRVGKFPSGKALQQKVYRPRITTGNQATTSLIPTATRPPILLIVPSALSRGYSHQGVLGANASPESHSTHPPVERCATRKINVLRAVSGVPPSPWSCGIKGLRVREHQNLWFQRTYRQNIADKRLSASDITASGHAQRVSYNPLRMRVNRT